MKNSIKLIIALVLFSLNAESQALRGRILDAKTHMPIEGALVLLLPEQQTAHCDEQGRFGFAKSQKPTSLQIKAIGYADKEVLYKDLVQPITLYLNAKKTELNEITIVSKAGYELRTVSQLDLKIKGINNSQEILRMVPGLFIGQHQGGGKAEQIFIRGFDCDHGTDINITADGIPVNMVSQAHGQGYADMHFVIPETVQLVDFQKGPYQASKGNFTTSGFVALKTKNALTQNQVKLEGGMFDTYRAMGLINLLGAKAAAKEQSLYVAGEYAYSKGFFDSPQNFNRYNAFLKYTGKLSNRQFLSASVSAFNSTWMASGQIPDRAVANGSIGFYGAIDPTEGGDTKRENINLQLLTNLSSQALLKNQIYFSHYQFNLHTNFTFYLEDSVNGDQIRQRENRQLLGYNGSLELTNIIGGKLLKTELGIGLRYDQVKDIELAHTINRNNVLNQLAFGTINEVNASTYLSETIKFSQRISVVGGLRFDQFFNHYTDHLQNDSLLKAQQGILSPKLSLYYYRNASVQYYVSIGKGFHSNDTRVCVTNKQLQVLPAAYSADLGTLFKPNKNWLVQTALWYLWLDQEFVYSGDAGYAEPSGKTKRIGIDFSLRYQAKKWLYADIDFNYAQGRFAEEREGENYIPLAPVISSSGGLTLKNTYGWNGSIRYRWLGNRPANENNSLIAKGYFVNDLVINYTKSKYEIGCSINNIFNVQWKETQFETTSKLKNEIAPSTEIHFTPGTKLAAKLFVSIFF